MKKSDGNDRTRSRAPLTKETVAGHNRILKKTGSGGIGPFGLLLPTPVARDNSGCPSDQPDQVAPRSSRDGLPRL
jgi:hypothetical protein